jgi:hypothetical protein
MFRRICAIPGVVACLSVVMVSASAHTQADRSDWPKGYSFVTLSSGRSYRVLSSGPVIGKGGKRLGMGVWYISQAQTYEQLKVAAQDLFEYIRPVAERQHDAAIILVAKLGFDPIRIISKSSDFGIIYDRDPAGAWRQHKVDETKPFPGVASSGTELPSPDPRAIARAKQDAVAWLAILDAGKFEESWDAASPSLKGLVEKASWVKFGTGLRSTLGTVVSRTQFSASATSTVPSAPPGTYVEIEFRSIYSNRSPVIEDVVEMMCRDGKWRVAGYHVE